MCLGSQGHRALVGGNKTYFLGGANEKETPRDIMLPTPEGNVYRSIKQQRPEKAA